MWTNDPRGKISILLKILCCKIETEKKKEKKKGNRGRKKNPNYESLILWIVTPVNWFNWSTLKHVDCNPLATYLTAQHYKRKQPILKTFILSHFYRLYLKSLSIECHWNSRQRKHRSDERSALPDRSVSFEWLPDWWRIKLKSTKVEAFKELWLKYCSVASRWFYGFSEAHKWKHCLSKGLTSFAQCQTGQFHLLLFSQSIFLFYGANLCFSIL